MLIYVLVDFENYHRVALRVKHCVMFHKEIDDPQTLEHLLHVTTVAFDSPLVLFDAKRHKFEYRKLLYVRHKLMLLNLQIIIVEYFSRGF